MIITNPNNRKKLGLIGKSLTHSFSKTYFEKKFKNENLDGFEYNLYPLNHISEFESLQQKEKNLLGLNVTIPYKELIIPYLDKLDEVSKTIGAVNTILFSDGTSKGFNTDVLGFENSLKPILKKYHKKALVFGSGGASKAVICVLNALGIEVKLVSREKDKADIIYSSIDEEVLNEYLLLINTTPLGMYPKVSECPDIPYQYLTTKHVLYDLIYNPNETLFLQNGLKQGCQIKNGLEMLQLQAEEAWKIWTSQASD